MVFFLQILYELYMTMISTVLYIYVSSVFKKKFYNLPQ